MMLVESLIKHKDVKQHIAFMRPGCCALCNLGVEVRGSVAPIMNPSVDWLTTTGIPMNPAVGSGTVCGCIISRTISE